MYQIEIIEQGDGYGVRKALKCFDIQYTVEVSRKRGKKGYTDVCTYRLICKSPQQAYLFGKHYGSIIGF